MFNQLIRELSQMSMDTEISSLSVSHFATFPTRPLTEEMTLLLSEKILCLPTEHMSILFLKYCFGMSPDEADDIFKTVNSAAKLRYAKIILTEALGMRDAIPDEKSLKEACDIALEKYTQDNFDQMITPNYSENFRGRLKDIKAAQKKHGLVLTLAKRVAIVVMVCLIGLTTAIATNAQLRDAIYYWIVETFSQYSIFSLHSSGDVDEHEVSFEEFVIEYIPNGYELVDRVEMRASLLFEYRIEGTEELISVAIYRDAKFYANTEGVSVDKMEFKNTDALYWTKGEFTHFVWSEHGVSFYIIGSCELDEVIKIAESIKK